MNMKKIYIALMLIITITCTNSMWAYADTTWDGANYGGSDVNEDGSAGAKKAKGTFVKKAGETTVYNVDVTWGAMEFNYKGYVKLDDTGSFYKAAGTTTTWVGSGNTIKVDNNSEAKVKATYSYQLDSSVITGPTVTCNPESIVVGTKAIKTDTSSNTCTVNIAGYPTKLNTTDLSGVPLGSVTIQLSSIID